MKKVSRFITIFMVSSFLFFVLTILSHKLFAVFTVSEVRLSAVLYPLLGINFGLPAALGITVANLIADITNSYPISVILIGIIPQFLYSMIPYYMWRYFVRNDEHKHRLDSVKRVLQFALVCFVSSFLAALVVGYFCMTNYNLNFFNVAIFVFLNNFEISIMFGCPLMIILNQLISSSKGTGKMISMNEKIIITFSIIEIIAIFSLVFLMYSKNSVTNTYDVWNTIYYYLVVLIAFSFVLALVVMIIFERMNKLSEKK